MNPHRSNGPPGHLTTAAELARPEPPPPPDPATAARHKFRYMLDGFEVETELPLPASKLRGYLDKLRKQGAEPIATPKPEFAPDGSPICPKHRVAMQRHGKHNDSWFSHSFVDAGGETITGRDGKTVYCKGFPAPSSPGWAIPPDGS